MTLLAVLADIHGNLPALDVVTDDLAQFDVDHVVVAGDIVNWGPFSAQVMQRVVEAGWAVIRGNNEFYLLDYQTPRAPAAWHEYTLLPWLHNQLQGQWHAIIAAWPDTLSLRFPDAPPLRIVHGTPHSPWQPILPNAADEEILALLESVEEITIVSGHTHLSLDRRVDRWHVLNPGSVGVPLDGLHEASYMLLCGDESGWHPTLRRIPFDVEPILAEFRRQCFEEQYGITARLVMDEFEIARLQIHPFLHWRSACCPGVPLTDELLEQFRAVNIWDYTPMAYRINMTISCN